MPRIFEETPILGTFQSLDVSKIKSRLLVANYRLPPNFTATFFLGIPSILKKESPFTGRELLKGTLNLGYS